MLYNGGGSAHPLPSEVRTALALNGSLKDFGLLQLLTLVQVTGKTGALTLQRGNEIATVYFEGGRLTKVKSPGSSSTSLGVALHRAGRIDRDQLELIGSQVSSSEKAAALLLTDLGVLSRDDIMDFVKERTLADLYGLLTWPDGTFRLDVDVSPPEDDIVTPIELAPVLEKGRGYLDEWNLLTSYIPSLDRSLRLLSEPRQPAQEVSLQLSEWRLVVSLAADIPLRDVAQKLGLNEFAVRQVAYRLIDAGLAEISEPVAVALPEPVQEAVEVPEPKGGGFARLFGRRWG